MGWNHFFCFKSGVAKFRSTLNMQNCFHEKYNGFSRRWITGDWNEENELWSINLFIHHYSPLSCSVCLSVSQCVRHCLSPSQCWITHCFKDTETVCRSPKAPSVSRVFFTSPLVVLRVGQSSTLMISPILGFREILARQVRGRQGRDVRRGQRGLIRIFLSQSDDPHCQVTS